MRPDRSPRALLRRLGALVASFWASFALHVGIILPLVLIGWLDLHFAPEETPGEEGTVAGPIGDGGGEVALGELAPVSVSIYEEPSATPVEAAEVVEPGPAPKATPKAPPAKQGAPDGDTDTQPDEVVKRSGMEGHAPRGRKKPCEPIEEIVSTGEDRWRVERDVVDYYVGNRKELEKQVNVRTHKDADGKPDGFRVFLSRCSVLRQAGIHHADIIHTINGRRVATLLDAITTYIALRNEQDLRIELTRKNGDDLVYRYHLKR